MHIMHLVRERRAAFPPSDEGQELLHRRAMSTPYMQPGNKEVPEPGPHGLSLEEKQRDDAIISKHSRYIAAFDAHHPPDPALIADCVHCGLCLPTCPTYLLWNEEMDSPRGRIVLMGAGLEEDSEMSGEMVAHFDACLGCMACVTACPSGVRYDQLIEATRPQVERNFRRPLGERLFRRLVFEVFTHPGRLRALVAPLAVAQASGLRGLVRRRGLLERFPRLAALDRLA